MLTTNSPVATVTLFAVIVSVVAAPPQESRISRVYCTLVTEESRIDFKLIGL